VTEIIAGFVWIITIGGVIWSQVKDAKKQGEQNEQLETLKAENKRLWKYYERGRLSNDDREQLAHSLLRETDKDS
jgi:enterochelin esterase-like enzyme